MIALLPLIAALSDASAPSLAYERYRLDNGLEVILHEDHRVPLVAVDLWVHVGAGDEVPGKSGFAHLFEHMMFQGSEHIPEEQHFTVLRGVGASAINGTTNFDRTNYFEVVPRHQLEAALWLESDRLGFLLPAVTEKSLANQRDVVRNERRQRYDNVPGGKTRFALFESMFPAGHPYRHLVIGKHEDIESASLEDVHGFFKQWYVPANATLAIGGDIDIQQTKTLVDKWFGALPKSAPPVRKKLPVESLAQNIKLEVRDPFTKLTELRWVWHAPPRFDVDAVDLEVAADVLGHRGWGRLFKLLVVERQLAQSVGASADLMGHQGMFNISVTLKPGSDAAQVEQLVRQELLRFLDQGPTAAEVRRSVVDTETSTLFGLDELMARVENLQTFNHFTGDPGGMTKYLQQVKSRTPESVKDAARRWLAKPRVFISTTPGGAQ